MKCNEGSVDVFRFAKFIMFSIIGFQLFMIKASNIHSVSSCMLSKMLSSAADFFVLYIYMGYI